MVKPPYQGQTEEEQRVRRKLRRGDEVEESKQGCICPEGCKIGEPVDARNPGSAWLVTCSSSEPGKVTTCSAPSLFIHAECMENWEDRLIYALQHSAGTMSKKKKGFYMPLRRETFWINEFEGVFKLCRCVCGGYLRKDMDYQPITQKENTTETAAPKKKKKGNKLPELGTTRASSRQWMQNPGHNSSASGQEKTRKKKSNDWKNKSEMEVEDEWEEYMFQRRKEVLGPAPVLDSESFPTLTGEQKDYWEPQEDAPVWPCKVRTTKPERQSESDIRSQEELLCILYDLIGETGKIVGLGETVFGVLGRLEAQLASEVCVAGGILGWLQSIGPSSGLVVQGPWILKRLPPQKMEMARELKVASRMSESSSSGYGSQPNLAVEEKRSLDAHVAWESIKNAIDTAGRSELLLFRLEQVSRRL